MLQICYFGTSLLFTNGPVTCWIAYNATHLPVMQHLQFWRVLRPAGGIKWNPFTKQAFSSQIYITRVSVRIDVLIVLGIFHHMVWQICFHYWWAAIPNQKKKSQHSRLWNEGKFHHFRSVVTNGKVNAFSVSCLDHETMTLQSSALGNCMLRDSFAEQCSPVLFCLLLCFHSLGKILASL